MPSLSRMFQLPDMVGLFAPEAHVRHMLSFEAALARAEAQSGVIPAAAAEAIAAACRIELYDVDAIYRDAISSGTVAIPVVRALVARAGAAGAPFVHWGATSQDVIDTALMLEMRGGLDLLMADLRRVAADCARLAVAHRDTLMPGRTLLQQATPITFGLKAARWLALTMRQLRALSDVRASAIALQFGGAAGTLAALGDAAPHVTRALGEALQLTVPELPWHAERDRVQVIASAICVAAGGMAKIAQDIVLLAQTEVGEVHESREAGTGGSSAMPQKHNPVNATCALAAARLALGQLSVVMHAGAHEHERAAGAWQAEWAAIPALFGFASGAVHHVSVSLNGLQVNRDRMRENLGRSGGGLMAEALSMALAPTLGRPDAQRVVGELTQALETTGKSLGQLAHQSPSVRAVLVPEAIDRTLDPGSYLGSTNAFIDQTLAMYAGTKT